MIIKKTLLIAFCIFFISNCAYLKTTKRKVHSKNYTLNVEEQASIGSPMITSEYTTYARGTLGHGLVEEKDSWQSFDYPTHDNIKEELIYNGRSENTIRISYKKYEKKLARPKFTQELTYDLGSSEIIKFKHYRIRVLNATGEYIRFLVLSD